MNLQESFSLFLYAFKLRKNNLDQPDSIWKRSHLEPDKNIFFSHVQDFFIKNNVTAGKTDSSCCLRYELNRDKLTDDQRVKLFLINQLFSRVSHLIRNTGSPISFSVILDNSILGPGILYNPLTGIAILSIGFSLTKDSNNLQNLIDLNYILRVFGRPDSGIFSIPQKDHPSALEQENKLGVMLRQFNKDVDQDELDGRHKWKTATLIQILLQFVTDR